MSKEEYWNLLLAFLGMNDALEAFEEGLARDDWRRPGGWAMYNFTEGESGWPTEKELKEQVEPTQWVNSFAPWGEVSGHHHWSGLYLKWKEVVHKVG